MAHSLSVPECTHVKVCRLMWMSIYMYMYVNVYTDAVGTTLSTLYPVSHILATIFKVDEWIGV